MQRCCLPANDQELNTVSLKNLGNLNQSWLVGAFVHNLATAEYHGPPVPSQSAAPVATASTSNGLKIGRRRFHHSHRQNAATSRRQRGFVDANRIVQWSLLHLSMDAPLNAQIQFKLIHLLKAGCVLGNRESHGDRKPAQIRRKTGDADPVLRQHMSLDESNASS